MEIAVFKVKSRNLPMLIFIHFDLNIWSCRSPIDANSIFLDSRLKGLSTLHGVILLIPIVLVPWGRLPLCHTPIRPISAFWDQISILIVGCVTTRFASYFEQKKVKLVVIGGIRL